MGIQVWHDDGYPPGQRRLHVEDKELKDPFGRGGRFGVLDGVSFYTPRQGPPLIAGFTQGELATRIVLSVFHRALPEDPIEKILVRANLAVRVAALNYGLSLEEPEHLPGCDIGAVEVTEEKVTVVSTSDSGVVLLMKDGSVWVTPNQSREYEQEVERIFAEIKAKHGGDLNAAWDEWLPIRLQMVRTYGNKRVPKGWAMINGERGFDEGIWQQFTFPRKDVQLAICYTDGATTLEDTGKPEAMAKRFVRLFMRRGLPAILSESRRKQRAKLSKSHETNVPEATLVAVPIEP